MRQCRRRRQTCAGTRQEPPAGKQVHARADGRASQESGLLFVPLAHGSARIRAGELRRSWRMANRRWQVPDRQSGHAAGRTKLQGPAGLSDILTAEKDAFTQRLSRKTANLCPRPGPRAFRPSGGKADRYKRLLRQTITASRALVLQLSGSLPFQKTRAGQTAVSDSA